MGACDVNLRAQSPDQRQSAPGSGSEPPRTFEQPRSNDRLPPDPPEDSGFRRRESGNGTTFSDEPEGDREMFNKPIQVPDPSAPAREPAPTEDPIPDDGGTDAPLFEDDSESAVPLLKLDDKVAWSSAPVRTRLKIRARFNDPIVARTKVDPNSRWLPVLTDTKIASK